MNVPVSDPPARGIGEHAARVRASRLEQAVGHLSAADAEAEAAEFARGLDAIRQWAAAHGGTDLPHGCVDESGFPLAVWVATQREAHLEDRLAPDRRAALESVPEWRWAPGAPDHGRARLA
ncbi:MULTISPECIES: helicase associated domain-containing protein [unclassified Frankia]|uniref:helicase associated domain-containing protein n=1 Tax=unclassified Frankia TaxID=2632575 RepID=UPI0027DABE90|nr:MULTISPECIES: helicase associated domain-containing protein [unclassified Frankia]